MTMTITIPSAYHCLLWVAVVMFLWMQATWSILGYRTKYPNEKDGPILGELIMNLIFIWILWLGGFAVD